MVFGKLHTAIWLWGAIFALIVFFSGCASLDAARGAAVTYGARAADDAREAAEWTLCNGISVGAWRRAYGADPARADGWRRLCAKPQGAHL